MNDLLTPPPERDLPGAGEIRRGLVAAVATDRRTSHRLLPAAAAAGVATVGAATVLGITQLTGSSVPAGSGGLPRPFTPPTREQVLVGCLGAGWRTFGPMVETVPDPAHPGHRREVEVGQPTTVAAVFTDDYGTIALLTGNGSMMRCSLNPDGSGDLSEPSITAIDRPDTPPADAAKVAREKVVVGPWTDWGSIEWIDSHPPTRDQAAHYVAEGRVAAGVARVVVTWPDHAPVEAAIGRGHFVARLSVPGEGRRDVPYLGFSLKAYDAHGRVVRTVTAVAPPRPAPDHPSPAPSR
jgi:hypothetical protein